MSTIATRLRRLTPALSAKERAVLVLRALNAGQEPDPQLHVIDDAVQGQIFNRHLGLIYVANIELDAIYQSLWYQVTRLEENTTLELLREAAALVQEQAARRSTGRSCSIGANLRP